MRKKLTMWLIVGSLLLLTSALVVDPNNVLLEPLTHGLGG